MKCKTKRAMQDPHPIFTESGRPATKGVCPVCGTTMFRMGATPAHANLPRPDPPKRDGKLVIVESPAKARTVGKFLGNPYRVKASIGHVRDLLRSRLSVDVENDFAPTYRVPKEKREVVKELQEEVKKASEVYLATDPDREGEAIAWHLMEAAKISKEQARRVVFHEITRDAIAEAFAHPRGIDMQLVNAQQARRILDRLVGYKVSPLLWEKVRSRLSAGRVQSVALRLVVEREREIQAFVPEEYWSLEAELAKQDTRGQDPRPSFLAKLHRIRDKKADLKNEADAQAIVQALEGAAYIVAKVDKRERRRRPSAPFTTSTMQQDASRRLGFTAKRTMAVAQQLYEGIDIGDGGPVGLITYMRTDSTNVAAAAQAEARDYIGEKFGAQYLPPKPPIYKTKAKGAQEAHEAIRPTSVWREPKAIKQYLTRDQYRLYELIWKRFVASQMAPAILDVTTVDIKAGDPSGEMPYLFRATGSVIKFPGFLRVYERPRGRDEAKEEGEGKVLPPLSVDEILDLLRLIPEQHFTQPPPRYSEATLVKALEKYGIGRPSTYAPILSTIQQRGYVERVDRRLHPTELGFIVNDLLVEHFPDIFNVNFTAHMEEDLDRIALGERDWVHVLREFYEPFLADLRRAEQNMPKVDLEPEYTGEVCEKCGHPMIVKTGRYGKFIACSNFPACRNTKPYQIKVGVACPECSGDLVEKRTRKGRIFYGCSNYPQCEFATWNRPLPQPCPACGGLLTVKNKEWARCIKCGEQVALARLEETELVEAG
ncbi:MAG: type I DNA topoisomerase [Anaerolineae bacterium]